jgi:hypothetical protein
VKLQLEALEDEGGMSMWQTMYRMSIRRDVRRMPWR